MEIMTNSATNCPCCTLEIPRASKIPASLRPGIEPQDEEKGEKQAYKNEATDKQVVRHLEHATDRFCKAG